MHSCYDFVTFSSLFTVRSVRVRQLLVKFDGIASYDFLFPSLTHVQHEDTDVFYFQRTDLSTDA